MSMKLAEKEPVLWADEMYKLDDQLTNADSPDQPKKKLTELNIFLATHS